MTSHATSQPSSPDEPLAASAPFALELASALCPDGQHGASCRHYHGFWQYLRLMGLGKTMSGLSSAFVDEVRGALQARQSEGAVPRVLISGGADYSAFAHVVAASRGLAVKPAVTALDICETPLVLTRWYAGREGWPVTTVCSDVVDYQPAEGYDVMLTSSFFGYFSPPRRRVLFAAYARMLKPGGVFVFANRLRPEPEDHAFGFSEEQAESFAGHAAALSVNLPPGAGLPPDKARSLAKAYAGALRGHPVNGEATLRALAEGAGLQWLRGGVRQTTALQKGVSGPTVGDGADYAFVTLQKPSPQAAR